ncbi:hypothetical protein [Cellulomonas sp. Marseille-Q8402]
MTTYAMAYQVAALAMEPGGLERDGALGEEVDDLGDQQGDLDRQEVCQPAAAGRERARGVVEHEVLRAVRVGPDGPDLERGVDQRGHAEHPLEQRHQREPAAR